jgi:type I restriction enzyme R subunit
MIINRRIDMNEAQTRLNKIDPKLRDAGWGIEPGNP